MIDTARDFWGLGVVLVTWAAGWVAWMFKLEARGRNNAADIRRMQEQRKEDRDRTDRRLDEISSDIKIILRGLDR